LLDPIVLSYGKASHSEHEHNPIGKREKSISHEQQPPEILDAVPAETLI